MKRYSTRRSASLALWIVLAMLSQGEVLGVLASEGELADVLQMAVA